MPSEPGQLLEAWIREVRAGGHDVAGNQALDLPAAAPILEASPRVRAAVLCLAVVEYCRDDGLLTRILDRLRGAATREWHLDEAIRALIYRLLRGQPPLEPGQLTAMLSALSSNDTQLFSLSLSGLLRVLEGHVARSGLASELRGAVEALQAALATIDYADHRRAARRLELLLAEEDAPPPPVVEPGIWGDDVLAWMKGLEPGRCAAWDALLQHAGEAAGRSKPTQRWLKGAVPLVEAAGREAFTRRLEVWMEAAKLGPTGAWDWDDVEQGMSDRNQDVLKGLIWAAAGLDDAALAHAVGRFAERCFRKIRNFGPGSKRLGNACVWSIGAMEGGTGVAQLSRLAGNVRYASGRRVIEQALQQAAARAGQTRDDLEELAVPDFGLDGAGARTIPVGDHAAELSLSPDGVALRWVRPDGRRLKGAPKALREQQPEEVKALRRRAREVGEVLEGQAARLERLWLQDRRLPLATLRQRYLAHPVVGQLGRCLLWLARQGDVAHELLWRDGRLATLGGEPVQLSDDAEVRLWHVLDAVDVERLLVWRDHLEQLRLVQPFKQVWREVYRPQEPRARADRRFAGHIIRQHPFISTCQRRGWQYTLQGHWDSHNLPTRALPRWGLQAELDVDPVDHQRDDTIFNYIVTGELRFYAADADLVDRSPLRLEEVSPLVFSEVLRDVDLFVGTCTVATDPAWSEAGIRTAWRDYWTETAWGALAPVAHTRREVLERVLPRTTLRGCADLEERWLVVRGSLATYRVHLGTANARREGDDRPLQVLPDRRARGAAAEVFLPFEGDSVLATILAKAFLLANDAQQDPATLRPASA